MEPREMLELMDEIRKRIPVSFREAKEALEDNGYDVVLALADLEEAVMPRKIKGLKHAERFLADPVLTLRRKGQDLIGLSPLAAAGLLLAGMRKPRFLLFSAAAVLFSGTDVVISYQDGQYSLHKAISQRSRKAAVNVHEMKELIDDRLHDLKDTGFRREGQIHGQHYFTFRV